MSTPGRFYRIAFAEHVSEVLCGAGSPHGRYHSEPHTAIYMSPSPDWAWTALEVYVREGDPPRVAVTLDVSEANVFDLRDSIACAAAGIELDDALSPWKIAMERGQKPRSWKVADRIRQLGFDGLIDRSRRIPDGWHLVLFKWNQPGSPIVRIAEENPIA